MKPYDIVLKTDHVLKGHTTINVDKPAVIGEPTCLALGTQPDEYQMVLKIIKWF